MSAQKLSKRKLLEIINAKMDALIQMNGEVIQRIDTLQSQVQLKMK